MGEALAWARAAAHPFTLAFACHFAAAFHECRRDAATARPLADEAVRHSTEHQFELFASLQSLHRGWQIGDAEEIRAGVAAYRDTGSGFGVPTFLGLLAEMHEKLAQPEAGLAVVADACALAESSGAHYWDAELERLRGALVLRRGGAAAEADAEECFLRAIDVAQRQRARSLELRAATRLARLWQGQGKIAAARKLLADACGAIGDGFATADLSDANELLAALDAAGARPAPAAP